MKHYVVIVCIYFACPLQAMNNDDIVVTMPFSHENEDKELELNSSFQCATLEDVKRFTRHHQGSLTEEYLKEHLDVLPSVFVEQYIQKHYFDNPAAQEIVKNSLFDLMTEMKNNNNAEYHKYVMQMLISYQSLFNEGSMTRGRKHIKEATEDPVEPLPPYHSIDKLVTQRLAENNNVLQETISGKEWCEKIYQISIAFLTAVAVAVPAVQAFLNTAAPPVIQSFVNCSNPF